MTLTEFIDSEFGPVNSPKRVAIEKHPWQIILGLFIVHERKAQNLTVKEIAERSEISESLVRTIELDASDINFSLIFKIIEEGLGHKVEIDIK